MKITKQAVLDKTHYGLNIYAHVLRQYYPLDTVLSLTGRECELTRNPFSSNAQTLKVVIADNCATHVDTSGAIPSGDVFDFACMHFKLEGEALYKRLNEVMHLRIGQSNGFYQKPEYPDIWIEPEPLPTIPPKFSYYHNPVSNTTPAKVVSLVDAFQLIRSDRYANSTERLRKIDNRNQARKFKAFNFDYVTFSGIFARRNDKMLKKHSGLLAIDFDHVPNCDELKDQLLEDKYFHTELLFTSPSGDGIKWIIPIDLTEAKHSDYFLAVANYIQHSYNIDVDASGKDVSRACFLPHDPQVYINHKYL